MNLSHWTFELILMGMALLCVLTAIPLAVVARRLERRAKRDALLLEIVRVARQKAREATQTGQIMAITTPFIRENVSVTKFGDKRRVTAPLTDLLRPATGPIPLPNEHVEPVD